MMRTIISLLLLLLAVCQVHAQTNPNPVVRPILRSTFEVHVEDYAQIPDFEGAPSKIVGIVRLGRALYITTSVSGGIIYRISPKKIVSKWFDVNRAMIAANGRPMDFRSNGHGGLRGLAFHPDYAQNGLFYVSCMEDRMGLPASNFRYLSPPPTDLVAHSVVLEFRVDLTTRKPLLNSYREVLRIGMPKFDHPIKQIAFRGKFLYITHGDGSVQSAVGGGGQNDDGLGKILRINPLQKGRRPYSVPKSNPFGDGTPYRQEIYALGFRNPHNLCFSKSGELFMVDVGRDNFEEINIVKSGGNYGWSEREGPFTHKPNFGIGEGIAPLPDNDALNGYEYPVAGVGHVGPTGEFNNGQALAGSCPIENRSLMRGMMLYANFPTEGNLYFSRLFQMRNAVTMGNPKDLRMARTFRPRIFYDHDADPSTPSIEVENMRAIMRMDPNRSLGGKVRVDLRFGQGKRGEIYWSSKSNGKIYLISSSLPGWTKPETPGVTPGA